MASVDFSTLISLATSSATQAIIKSAANALADHVSGSLPLTKTADENVRLRSLDRRLSIGLTKHDGKLVLALLVEKSESPAEKRAEAVATGIGQLNQRETLTILTGTAHSSKVDDGIQEEFEWGIGTSIGNVRGTPGSIGCLVKIKARTKEYKAVTSAAHVLSMLNRAEKGDPIIVPGHPDGPKALNNRIGSLIDYTFLNHYSDDEKWANLMNHEDIAAVALDEPDGWPDTNLVPDPDNEKRKKKLQGVVTQAELVGYIGATVSKVGRTTGLTSGTLEIVGIQQYPIRLPDNRIYMYRDLLAVKKSGRKLFSMPGDSGALVYTQDFKALGFVIGGSEDFCFVATAERSLKSIKAELV